MASLELLTLSSFRTGFNGPQPSVAYFLEDLDRPDCMEVNGRSSLENGLITISTELGYGRHRGVKRNLSDIFEACTGANGRLKTGQILDAGAEGLDV